MIPRIVVSVTVYVLCFSNIALSDVKLSSQFSKCIDDSGGVTAAMLDCINQEHTLQDARLNKAYKKVMSQLTPERQKELKDAQRAWIKYRDANCNFYFDPDGGTAASLSGRDCFMTTTASRAEELENFIDE
ncbi:conserved exported hypothetical protein [Desulfamplus magnetovallimortis]|uniref:Lysozyme inhibitor LprI-like N-terminal domain-containing protein n=1 Tax=Desulfamplus magnetovallimortis TaxID=1246637 RepID=A0A1W1HEA7_9BACT|nr:lysozyme inhibitor LprI family protein [Desulfamplus magnetovallimortis]SLM30827.1 conserved exported hypothetical protein [Desulfamplus magnetovallimortis]